MVDTESFSVEEGCFSFSVEEDVRFFVIGVTEVDDFAEDLDGVVVTGSVGQPLFGWLLLLDWGVVGLASSSVLLLGSLVLPFGSD